MLFLFQNSISTPVTGAASIFGLNHVQLIGDGDNGDEDDDGDGDVEDVEEKDDDEEADYVSAEVSSQEVHLPKTNSVSAAPPKKIPGKEKWHENCLNRKMKRKLHKKTNECPSKETMHKVSDERVEWYASAAW